MSIDEFESFGEPLARFRIDFMDRLLGIANGVEQILALRIQEVVPLLGFFKLLHSLSVHRAQRFNPRPHVLVALLRFRQAVFIQHSLFRLCHLIQAGVQFLAAGLFQVLQFRLALY